jgi:hypothetical protein
MQINFIKKVEILSSELTIKWDKTNDGGSFNLSNAEIAIGIKSYKTDPLYTISVISHEVMEAILVNMGARFMNSRTSDNYLFNFDHQTFENAIQIHTQVMNKFLK